METQLRQKCFKLILYSYGIKRMERHDKYIGNGVKNKKIQKEKFFSQKQKKKKKFFDVTMLLILVNYSSSNLKSLIN